MKELNEVKKQIELVIFGLGKFAEATDNDVAFVKEKLKELVNTDFSDDIVVDIVNALEPLREITKKYKGVKDASLLNGYILKLYDLLKVQDRILQMEIEMYNATHAEELDGQEEAVGVDLWKYKEALVESVEAVRKQVAGHFMNEYYVVNLSVNGPGCVALLLAEMKSSLKDMFHFVNKDLGIIRIDKYAPWNEEGANDSVIYFVDDIDKISDKNWFAQRPGYNDLVADAKGRIMLRVNLVSNESEKR